MQWEYRVREWMNRIWLTFALMYEPEAFGRHHLATHGRRSHLRVIRTVGRTIDRLPTPEAGDMAKNVPGGGSAW